MREPLQPSDRPSVIAMLVVTVAVTFGLGALTELPFLWSGLIAVPAGLIAAGITHAVRTRGQHSEVSGS